MNNEIDHIGAAVRQRRKQMGLTLQQVVDKTEGQIDTGGLSRAERGEQQFAMKTLECVAEALDTTVAQLFNQIVTDSESTPSPTKPSPPKPSNT